jgi:hypothetical protein
MINADCIIRIGQRLLSPYLVRKERWTLTILGVTMLTGFVLVVVWVMLRGLFSFLACSCPNREGIMIVEGWIRTSSIPQVVREYEASRYQYVVVVNAVYDSSDKWVSGRFQGEYLTNALVRRGIPRERIALVTCDVVKKDRTYHSALAVQDWLRLQGKSGKMFDVVTMGAHARRSGILFKRAFPKGVYLGVIALDECEYDPEHWWRSSEGVREVLFEGVAYLYVLLFFHPK